MMGNGSGSCSSSSKALKCGDARGWRFFLLAAAASFAILFGQAGSASAAAYFETGSMSAPRQDHTATLLDDGTVLVTGGLSTSNAIIGTADIYEPSSGTFTATAGAMNATRQYHTATKLDNGKVLITGGITSGTGAPIASAEIYDPLTGTFTPTTGPMTVARRNHTATLLLNGKVLIAGGRSTNSSNDTLASAELFDPVSGSFTATGAMPTARAFHTASRLTVDGRVLVAGGLTTGGGSVNNAEIFDPAGNGGVGAFTATGNMQVARNYHSAVVLNDGRVLITGGSSGSVAASLATAELFDPAAGTFALTTGGMVAGHSRHTSVLLSDGSVLIAGDFSDLGVPGAASEVFLPDFGEVFQPRDPMNTARSNFRAIRLANGTVLLAGGATGFPTVPTAAAELYDPSSVRVVPAGHAFPDTVIGTTSAPQAFTISTNAGIAIAPFTITGTDATRFAVSATTCSTQPVPPVDPENPPPPSLPGGGSCTVSVTFTPGILGPKSANLIILTDDLAIPTWTIPLSGTGVPVPPVLLTVTAPLGGTVAGPGITCPGDCSETFTNGTPVTLTAAASTGFLFTGWSGACAASGTNPVCTIAALTANASVSASFADVTPPALALSTLPGGASTANAVLNIVGSATDNVGVTSLTINGKPVIPDAAGSFSYALKLAAGANIITSVAADAAANSTTDTRTITLDPTVPLLTVTAPADNSATAASLIPVSGTADATATLLTLTVNGGSSVQLISTNGTDFVSASDVPLTPGVNTLIITAAIPGGKTATVKRTVFLDASLPSLAVTVPNQDEATIQRQGFTIGGTASGLTPVTVTITVPNTPPFTPALTGGAFTQLVDFTVSKTYPIIVTATDENNNTVTTVRNIIFSIPADGNMDLSADGNVTIADALMALRASVNLFTPSAEQKLHGDVAPLQNGVPNPDGLINIADALLILRKVVGLVTW